MEVRLSFRDFIVAHTISLDVNTVSYIFFCAVDTTFTTMIVKKKKKVPSRSANLA